MITREEAFAIAQLQVGKMGLGEDSVSLLLDETLEESFGWVFFYNSNVYLETGNLSYALAGNAPFIIDRESGTVHYTGTAEPIETYIERYNSERRKQTEA